MPLKPFYKRPSERNKIKILLRSWYRYDMIYSGITLLDVRNLCEAKMLELGADSFWYWDVGAFVFAGDETTLSVSGKEYTTSQRVIAENDIITIDLSPQNGDTWGDYARTFKE